MKHLIALFLITALLLSSCDLLETLPDVSGLMPQNTPLPPTEPPTQTSLPANTPTVAITPATPTFTTTPTMIGLMPPAVNLPISTPDLSIPLGTGTPVLSQYGGFIAVYLSNNLIYWGICSPSETIITATVEDPKLVYSVILFVRLKDKKYDDETEWKGMAMDKEDGGHFTYKLKYKNIDDYGHFFHAWVLYQLVATNKNGDVVGRTPVAENRLSLEACP